jgi:hypothetical protein
VKRVKTTFLESSNVQMTGYISNTVSRKRLFLQDSLHLRGRAMGSANKGLIFSKVITGVAKRDGWIGVGWMQG